MHEHNRQINSTVTNRDNGRMKMTSAPHKHWYFRLSLTFLSLHSACFWLIFSRIEHILVHPLSELTEWQWPLCALFSPGTTCREIFSGLPEFKTSSQNWASSQSSWPLCTMPSCLTLSSETILLDTARKTCMFECLYILTASLLWPMTSLIICSSTPLWKRHVAVVARKLWLLNLPSTPAVLAMFLMTLFKALTPIGLSEYQVSACSETGSICKEPGTCHWAEAMRCTFGTVEPNCALGEFCFHESA